MKDEIGFLSEYAAYYRTQGIERIIFMDNNSSTSFDEIQPWVDIGFASVRLCMFMTLNPGYEGCAERMGQR